MSRKTAYIQTKPTEIKFAALYPDNSGEKFSLEINSKQTDVLFKQCNDRILIDINDIDFLIKALEDIKEVVSLPNSEQNPERSVANGLNQG